jgi:hypothetical protein
MIAYLNAGLPHGDPCSLVETYQHDWWNLDTDTLSTAYDDSTLVFLEARTVYECLHVHLDQILPLTEDAAYSKTYYTWGQCSSFRPSNLENACDECMSYRAVTFRALDVLWDMQKELDAIGNAADKRHDQAHIRASRFFRLYEAAATYDDTVTMEPLSVVPPLGTSANLTMPQDAASPVSPIGTSANSTMPPDTASSQSPITPYPKPFTMPSVEFHPPSATADNAVAARNNTDDAKDMPIAHLAEQFRVAHAEGLRQWLSLPTKLWTVSPDVGENHLGFIFGYEPNDDGEHSGYNVSLPSTGLNTADTPPSLSAHSDVGLDADAINLNIEHSVPPLPRGMLPHAFNFPPLGHGQGRDHDNQVQATNTIVPDERAPTFQPKALSDSDNDDAAHGFQPKALSDSDDAAPALATHAAVMSRLRRSFQSKAMSDSYNNAAHSFQPKALSDSDDAAPRKISRLTATMPPLQRHRQFVPTSILSDDEVEAAPGNVQRRPFIPTSILSDDEEDTAPGEISRMPQSQQRRRFLPTNLLTDSENEDSSAHQLDAVSHLPTGVPSNNMPLTVSSAAFSPKLAFQPKGLSESEEESRTVSSAGSSSKLAFQPKGLSDSEEELLDSEDSFDGQQVEDVDVAHTSAQFTAEAFRDIPDDMLDIGSE